MDEERNHMSKFKLILALLGVVLFIGLGIGTVIATSPPPCTSMTRYGVPGDTFTLNGPIAPTGVTYTYLWTVVDSTNTQVFTAGTQNTAYPIPASPASYYVVTLSVGSGVGSGQLTGCVLQSCLNISVQSSNTCGISGPTSLCQTNTTAQYTYTGNAAISGANPTAYLEWIVDTTTKVVNDATGKYIVNWPTIWTSGNNVAQTHNVIVNVHSKKSNAVLSTCTYPVKVLPLPDTTISPT